MKGERGQSSYPELPKELADFLSGQDLAAVTHETSVGTALVVMAPTVELSCMSGDIPVGIDHQLFTHPSAPVIRMVTSFYDVADDPMMFETFFNVGDPQQRREYEGLSRQEELPILLYDQDLNYRHGKRVRIPNGDEIAAVLDGADRFFRTVPADRFDFEKAKQEVIATTEFPEFPYR